MHRSANPVAWRSGLGHSRSPCLHSSVPLVRIVCGHRGDCRMWTGRKGYKATGCVQRAGSTGVCSGQQAAPAFNHLHNGIMLL